MAVVLLALLALLAPASSVAEQCLVHQMAGSQFSGFLQLLRHADLIHEIEAQSGQGLTVFAPTDDALTYHTSPALLAFLKLEENKETLRHVLRRHIVAHRLSPFQWEGAHPTLGGHSLRLGMDAQAFYAGNAAVQQYNALVGTDGAVHSLPALLIPEEGLGAGARAALERGSEIRRVLAAAPAPEEHSSTTPSPPASISTPPPSSSAASAGTSLLAIVAAAAMAVGALAV